MILKQLKIAIYSGEIPSTTFIERLIKALPSRSCFIYLFGIKTQHVHYAEHVKVFGYQAIRLFKFFYLVKYWFLLTVFRFKEKRLLHSMLKRQSNYRLNVLVKNYPVLWHKPDIFHVQWAKGLEDWLWVKDFGIKLVLSLRGAHINYSPLANPALAAIYKASFPNVDGFHAVSEAIALEAIKLGASSDKIKVVKSGLDLNAFPFNPKTYDLSQPLKIISIGRAHWKKNYSLALDALALLKVKNLSFSYTILGVGDDEALQFQRAQLGLEEVVFFKAFKSMPEVIDAINQADVLLLPSLEEGIANVVLEAMALGTIVISTDCGGMREVVIEGNTGFLVPIQDPKAISVVLERFFLMTAQEYLVITKNARKFVEVYHTENVMVEGMMDLYNFVKPTEE